MCEVSRVAMTDSTVSFQTNWQTNTKRNRQELLFYIALVQKSKPKEIKISKIKEVMEQKGK